MIRVNNPITYFKAPELGGTLTAVAKEINLTRRTGTYAIETRDEKGQLIANCQALVYRKDSPLPFLED